MTVRYLSLPSILFLIVYLRKIMFEIRIFFVHIEQPVRSVIMDKTAHVFAPQTARHVNLPTAHVVVMLVGWGLTVVLVLYF